MSSSDQRLVFQLNSGSGAHENKYTNKQTNQNNATNMAAIKWSDILCPQLGMWHNNQFEKKKMMNMIYSVSKDTKQN